MNARLRNFVTALGVCAIAATGAACATTSNNVAATSAMTDKMTLADATSPPATAAPSTTTSGAPTAMPPTAPSTPSSPAATAPGASGTNMAPGTAASTTGTGTSENAEAKKIFDELDTNHDGTLTFEEFSRATIRPK